MPRFIHTKICPTSFRQGKLRMQKKLLGIVCLNLDVPRRLRIVYSSFVKYMKKNGLQKTCVYIGMDILYDNSDQVWYPYKTSLINKTGFKLRARQIFVSHI